MALTTITVTSVMPTTDQFDARLPPPATYDWKAAVC
ncbi:MAG: hypothetical protein JWN44_3024, partial [Myxococcales bacterium]|nr:hypothetical protein [Myxococcales bacterium]